MNDLYSVIAHIWGSLMRSLDILFSYHDIILFETLCSESHDKDVE